MDAVNKYKFSAKNIRDSIKIPSKTFVNWLCLFSVIVVSLLWAFTTFNKTAPAPEGWYIVYADMILEGMVPYIDFELLYLPLYAYMSALAVAIFGNGLLAFRTIGALLFVSIAVVTFFMINSVASSWIAAIGSLLTVFTLQGDVWYISYDNHSVFILFAFISAYFMLKSILKRYNNQESNIQLYLLLSGVMCSFAISIRPQSGVMLLAYFVLSFIVIHFFIKKVKISLKSISYYLLGVFIPLLVTGMFLIHAGAFSDCIEMVFLGGTKGSIVHMLIGWIPYIYPSLILSAFIFLPYLVYISIKRDDTKNNTDKIDYLFYFSMILVVSICIIGMFSSLEKAIDIARYTSFGHGGSWVSTMFVLQCVIVLTLCFKMISQKNKGEDLSSFDTISLFLGGFAIFVAYGEATSIPLNYVGTALTFGLVIMTLLHNSIKHPKTIIKSGVKVIIIIFAASLILSAASAKVITPYNWWGGTSGSYVDAIYDTDVDYFQGIELTYEQKYMYEDFEDQVNIYLGVDDNLYCYANIPIFYTIANKIPTTKGVVPWFDVSRESTIYEDLEYLKSNNPKMIVFNDHTMFAISAHESLFGDKSAHYELYTWLFDCMDNVESKYEVVSTYEDVYNTYVLVLK